jgi:hypothetical protein
MFFRALSSETHFLTLFFKTIFGFLKLDIFKNVQKRKSPRLFKLELLLKILTEKYKHNMLRIMVTLIIGVFVTIFYEKQNKRIKNSKKLN